MGPSSTRAIAVTLERLGKGALALAVLGGCGLVVGEPGVGGESHFLGGCGNGCSDGLRCLAGVCSRSCGDRPLECSDLAAGASCRQGATAANEAVCDLPCVNDASCANAGAGLECQSGFCRAAPAGSTLTSREPASRAPDPADPWWCLDQPVPELPPARRDQVVTFVAQVLEFGTLSLITEPRATLCGGQDFACSMPLSAASRVPDAPLGVVPLAGSAAVLVPEGFDGFIRFGIDAAADTPEDQQFVPHAYFLGGIISGDLTAGPSILLERRGTRRALVQQSFPAVDAQLALAGGSVELGVYDCNGSPVSDARIELSAGGLSPADAVPFQIPGSRIPIAQALDQPLYTGSSGLVGYLNVAPGAVQARAYRRGDTEPFGTIQLGVVAEQISQGAIRPAYLNSADLSGAPWL